MAATPLIPGPGQASVTQAAGGSAASADGSATIALSPGSVASTVALSVTRSSVVPTGIVQLSPVFDLKAVDVATGAAIDSFATAPVLTIHYDPSGPTPTSIFFINPSGQAVAVQSTAHTAPHALTAAPPRFRAPLTTPAPDTGHTHAFALNATGTDITITTTDLTTSVVTTDTAPISQVDTVAISGYAGHPNTLTIDAGADTNIPGGIDVNFTGGARTPHTRIAHRTPPNNPLGAPPTNSPAH